MTKEKIPNLRAFPRQICLLKLSSSFPGTEAHTNFLTVIGPLYYTVGLMLLKTRSEEVSIRLCKNSLDLYFEWRDLGAD